jgi:hypothetical protein
MAIIGINTNKKNPPFTKVDFLFWMPQFTKVENLDALFENLYPIANNKIFESIYGSDWKMAMSLCIAHYATLIGNNTQLPQGTSLASIAGGGTTKGVLQSATIGNFSKTYDLDRSMVAGQEMIWWNSTSYGAQLMALMKTKGIPSILVVTSNPVPGAN